MRKKTKSKWQPTHEIAFDRGLWIPVVLRNKRWIERGGDCLGRLGDVVREYKRRKVR